MATLDAKKRASLPDTAFAYVDSRGNRRLPINDEAHVRNALSRFNQVKFESEEARERAFGKLLTAASTYGIAPIGFVTRQLREARSGLKSGVPSEMPSGTVTLLLSDIEDSTSLVRSLGKDYQAMLEQVRSTIREQVSDKGGYEVDSRADEFFAAFARASDGVEAAIEIQRGLEATGAKVRIGLHSGSPALTDTGYVGLPVHVTARVCNAGHGGQILVTAAAREELAESLPEGVRLESLGEYLLRGLPESEELFQVDADGLDLSFPALRVTALG
jgi:class 3 adenylate cyclase